MYIKELSFLNKNHPFNSIIKMMILKKILIIIYPLIEMMIR